MQKVFEIRHLVKEFPGAGSWLRRKQQTVKAINDVSFDIFQGETFGLVGESGCGKSTTAQLLIRLLEPTSGDLFFQGTNIAELSEKAFNAHRRNIQMIFQDPYAAMNPRMTIKRIISEPLITHHVDEDLQDEREMSCCRLVALSTSYRDRYPHEFFRRTAAAHLHCPVFSSESGVYRGRRAGRGVRCFDSVRLSIC